MTADTAVSLMLEHDILPNKLIPVEACPYIAKALEMMWQVGYESGLAQKSAERPVGKFSIDGKPIITYPNQLTAAIKNGIDRSTLRQVLNGKRKTAAGFIWRYAEVG